MVDEAEHPVDDTPVSEEDLRRWPKGLAVFYLLRQVAGGRLSPEEAAATVGRLGR